MRRYDEAEPLYLEATGIVEKAAGREHPGYATALHNLAGLYEEMGRYVEAERRYRQVCDLLKNTLGESHPAYANVLGSLLAVYVETREYDKAVPLLSRLIEIREATVGRESREYAALLTLLANLYFLAGEYAKAEPLFVQARDIQKTVLGPRDPEYAATLYHLGSVYAASGHYAEAEKAYVEARNLQRELLGEEHPDYVLTVMKLANVYMSRGDYAEAERQYLGLMETSRSKVGEDHPDYATVLNNLSAVYISTGDYEKAERLCLEARRIATAALDEGHSDYDMGLNNLAELYRLMGKYAKAEALCREALDIRRKAGRENDRDYAGVLNTLAEVYRLTGEYAKAELLYREARNVMANAVGRQHLDYAAMLNNRALFYCAVGEYVKAEPLLLEAREITGKAVGTERVAYATALNNLALLYSSMGDYGRAEPLYLKSRDITRRSLGVRNPGYAVSLCNLAGLYACMGDYARAKSLYLETCDIRKDVLGGEHPDYAAALSNLASLYTAIGSLADAERFYRQALEIQRHALGQEHPDYATTLNNLAGVYVNAGDYGKAESLYLEAAGVESRALGKEHPAYALTINNLALLYMAMGDHARAELFAREAMEIRLAVAEKVLPWLSEHRALRCIQQFEIGCDVWLSILRRLPQASGAEAYPALWQSRGLVTRMLSRRRRILYGSPEAEAVYVKLRAVQQELAHLALATVQPRHQDARRMRLDELNERKEQLESTLARLSQAFRRSADVQSCRVEDLKRALPEGWAVVEFIRRSVVTPPESSPGNPRAEMHYEAFVVRASVDHAGEEIPWLDLGPAAAIDDAVDQWRKRIVGKDIGRHPAVSPPTALRSLIWERVESHLVGCSAVIIVPDGRLNFLPWAALPGREPGTCLLEDYVLATAQSGPQLYEALTAQRSPSGSVLLIGNVAYDAAPSAKPEAASLIASAESDLHEPSRGPAVNERRVCPPLKGTKTEIKAAKRMWQGSPDPVVLTGAEANEMALRRLMPRSRHVHLATHGFFADATFRSMFGQDVASEQLFGGSTDLVTARQAQVAVRNPLILSGVVLAGANLPPQTDELGLETGRDGILTAEEIVSLDLRNTELVVLSACDTGLGAVARGEGVMGLVRAFRLAGARNVVASLWEVEDKATAALMKVFYYKLWKEGKPPIEALREAQLTIYRDPDLIDELADVEGEEVGQVLRGPRGPVLEPVPIPKEGPSPAPRTADPRDWAAFVLSGPGD